MEQIDKPMTMVPASSPPSSSAGFSYLALLFAISILGAVLSETGIVWQQIRQREKERELLFIGHQFREAIGNYYQHTSGPVKRYPQKLEDLLLDSRQLSSQRYLRKIYHDPMTGKAEWGLVEAPEGGIMGVHSLSGDAALKRGHFHTVDQMLEGKVTYASWLFIYTPPPPAAEPPPASPGQ